VTSVRKIAAVGAVPFVLIGLAGPADAHGSMTNPISRTTACGPEGGHSARSRACRAARAVSNAAALRAWDSLRVHQVNGRDRQRIPDGKLCSGGLDAYRGLDLPRPDWPSTRLTAGARFAFGYRATIPHPGTFKLYVTRNGYDPTRRLKWSDLEARPFLAVSNPPLRGGSYVIKGRLPRGKSGRHVIYTIWQNTSPPDTYYACSDVVFGGRRSGAGGTAAGAGAAGQSKRKSEAPASEPAPRGTESVGAGDPGGQADGRINAANKSSNDLLPLATGGGATVLALAGGAAFVLARRRRMRRPIGPSPAGPSPAGPNVPGPGRTWQGFPDQSEESW
jgi:chitin-binding protein